MVPDTAARHVRWPADNRNVALARRILEEINVTYATAVMRKVLMQYEQKYRIRA